jgi:4-amino-4-deoxy-L-arabinose transferase-like glycosyltransferase
VGSEMRPRCPRVLAALLALIIMLAFVGHPPVQRTQEARVLQTAREMLGGDWLIPHLNGEIRLEKPPLAYWLAAIAFKIGGVSEGIGRVPFAAAAWLTVVLIYFAGRWMANERTGMLGGAVLLGMWMFSRHGRLAETDVLATLFVTASSVAIWRGWHRTSAAMIGATMMAKGLPAAFPLLFLIALAGATRDWKLLWRWTKSGAPLIALAIGTPWFIYAAATVGGEKFAIETERGLRGLQHANSPFQYFPQLFVATLPWSVAVIIAIVVAVQRWRQDEHARALLLWFCTIFVPLLFAGQRQLHYLMPSLPPLALLAGWLIHVAAPDVKMTRALVLGIRPPVMLAIICAVVVALVAQLVAPALRPQSPRTVAARIRTLGPGPYCFYGRNLSLPLLFYLGNPMPQVETPEELSSLIARSPDLIVIGQTKSGVAPPPPPPDLIEVLELDTGDQKFEVYRSAPSRQSTTTGS